jgi:hypothetical protein
MEWYVALEEELSFCVYDRTENERWRPGGKHYDSIEAARIMAARIPHWLSPRIEDETEWRVIQASSAYEAAEVFAKDVYDEDEISVGCGYEEITVAVKCQNGEIHRVLVRGEEAPSYFATEPRPTAHWVPHPDPLNLDHVPW